MPAGIGLVAAFGVRGAIANSVIPGLAATVAILYAIRHTPRPAVQHRRPIKLRVRPVLRGDLGRRMGGIGAFELGNCAATLLILRATQIYTPGSGVLSATRTGLLLYTAYNAAAAASSFPAGRAHHLNMAAVGRRDERSATSHSWCLLTRSRRRFVGPRRPGR